eukprot:scaffold21531_cov63-Phaeocystis_antarctica.AAC.4
MPPDRWQTGPGRCRGRTGRRARSDSTGEGRSAHHRRTPEHATARSSARRETRSPLGSRQSRPAGPPANGYS